MKAWLLGIVPPLAVGVALGWILHATTHDEDLHLALSVIAGMLLGYFYGLLHQNGV